MKNIFIMLLLPVFSLTAQTETETETDPSKKRGDRFLSELNDKFPTTRFLDLQYEIFTKTDYDSKLGGRKYETGTINGQERFKAALNIPIVKSQRWAVFATAKYKVESYEYTDVQYTEIGTPILRHETIGDKEDYHFFSAGANVTYFSKLFGRPFITNAIITAEGSDEGYERIHGLVSGSFIFKKTSNVTFGAGLLLTSNNVWASPVLPVLIYENNFKGSKWVLDIFIPRHVYLRRQLLENGRLSLGSVYDTEIYFLYPDQPGYTRTYSYSRHEVKTGLMYEYKLNSTITATLRGGIATIFNAELRERDKSDEIAKTTQDSNGFINIGFSYSPFKF